MSLIKVFIECHNLNIQIIFFYSRVFLRNILTLTWFSFHHGRIIRINCHSEHGRSSSGRSGLNLNLVRGWRGRLKPSGDGVNLHFGDGPHLIWGHAEASLRGHSKSGNSDWRGLLTSERIRGRCWCSSSWGCWRRSHHDLCKRKTRFLKKHDCELSASQASKCK